MKLKQFALSLALIAPLGLVAAHANAATMSTTGSFSLPEPAYWNETLLPAGDYTLSVGANPAGITVFSVKGEGITVNFLAMAVTGDTPERNELKLEDTNGTYVIREFDAGTTGESYRFGVSKTVRNLMSRKEAPAVTVPVSGL